jgi:hypothetical protein
MIEKREEIPMYNELSNYRGSRKIELLDIWCTHFFPAVAGTHNFRRNAAKTCLSNFVMVSDEAFALTVLENFYERWIEEGKSKVDGKPLDADNLPSAKWTQGTSQLNKCGWSSDGIQKFNANKMAVEMHRQLDDSVKLEETYLIKVRAAESANQGRMANKFKRKNEEVVSKDDFSPLPEKITKKIKQQMKEKENDQASFQKRLEDVDDDDEDDEDDYDDREDDDEGDDDEDNDNDEGMEEDEGSGESDTE